MLFVVIGSDGSILEKQSDGGSKFITLSNTWLCEGSIGYTCSNCGCKFLLQTNFTFLVINNTKQIQIWILYWLPERNCICYTDVVSLKKNSYFTKKYRCLIISVNHHMLHCTYKHLFSLSLSGKHTVHVLRVRPCISVVRGADAAPADAQQGRQAFQMCSLQRELQDVLWSECKLYWSIYWFICL